MGRRIVYEVKLETYWYKSFIYPEVYLKPFPAQKVQQAWIHFQALRDF